MTEAPSDEPDTKTQGADEGANDLHAAIQRQLALARRAQEASQPKPAENLDDEFRRAALDRRKSDVKLAKAMGWATLGLLVAQALIIDAGFLVYAAEIDWQLPAEAIIAWLGAGVIQIIGSVALVVARYLFPGDGGSSGDGQ